MSLLDLSFVRDVLRPSGLRGGATDEEEVYERTYRLLCVLLALLVPAFWLLYHWTPSSKFDPLWLRLLMSALFFAPVPLSRMSRRVRAHLRMIVQGAFYVVVVYITVLTVVSRFPPGYALGLLFTAAASSIGFSLTVRQAAPLVRYLVFTTVFTSVAAFATPLPPTAPFNAAAFTMCVASTMLVVLVATQLRLYALKCSTEHEKRFRAALAGSLDALLLFEGQRGPDGTLDAFVLVDLNARARALLGLAEEEVLGRSLRTLLPHCCGPHRFDAFLEVTRTGTPFEEDVPAPLGRGGPAWGHLQVVPTDEGVALTLRDITERKEKELETARRKNFYEQVMEAVPSLAVFDREKRFVYLNANAVSDPELRQWLIGKTDLDYCRRRGKDPTIAHRRMEHIERVLRTGETERFEERFENAEGPDRHHVLELSPVTDLDGEITQVAGYVMNITERKRAEEQLRASERRYRTLLEAANDAIFIADPDSGQLLDANRRAQALTGYSLEELRQMPPSELHPPEERDVVQALFEEHMQDETGHAQDCCIYTKAGRCVPVDISASVVEVEGQALMLAIFRDVTDRKRYEQQLIEAREHAEEMLRLKTDILNNMSHELRTPLTSVLGFSEMLSTELSGHKQEFADIIHTSARRLQQTLNSVLAMAQLEHGEVTLDMAPLTLADEVKDALPILQPLAEKEDLVLRTDLAAPEAQARLDEAALHRILQNLAGNALKFTEEGHVTLAVEASASQVHLHVRDTGVGISDDFLPHLFSEFRQQSRGLSRRFEGSGLGLAITKRLVEMMEGTIEVESEEGKGTTFTVSFPRLHAADLQSINGSSDPSRQTRRLEGTQREHWSRQDA